MSAVVIEKKFWNRSRPIRKNGLKTKNLNSKIKEAK